jgi:hypothetical protein
MSDEELIVCEIIRDFLLSIVNNMRVTKPPRKKRRREVLSTMSSLVEDVTPESVYERLERNFVEIAAEECRRQRRLEEQRQQLQKWQEERLEPRRDILEAWREERRMFRVEEQRLRQLAGELEGQFQWEMFESQRLAGCAAEERNRLYQELLQLRLTTGDMWCKV